MSTTRAVYPGTFDPITNGHEDLIQRASRIFGEVVVGVAHSQSKRPFFSLDERVALARDVLQPYKNVRVLGFTGLLSEFVKQQEAGLILRGLRAVSDFEYEFQLASMNRKLNRDVETVFMMTSEESFYLSSRLVREVASFGGDITGIVPEPVRAALEQRFARKGAP